MGGSNLAQAANKSFWIDPIYHNTMNEASRISQSVYFVTRTISRRKSYPINVLLLVFWKSFCCCSCYCLSRTSLLDKTVNWRPGTLFWHGNFLCFNLSWSDLMQEIQFLEFMGRSNTRPSNYLIFNMVANMSCQLFVGVWCSMRVMSCTHTM